MPNDELAVGVVTRSRTRALQQTKSHDNSLGVSASSHEDTVTANNTTLSQVEQLSDPMDTDLYFCLLITCLNGLMNR